MMTEVAENMVDEVTIVVVIDETVMAVDEIMVVAAEIEADRQDGIIVVMIAMTVEGIYHIIWLHDDTMLKDSLRLRALVRIPLRTCEPTYGT